MRALASALRFNECRIEVTPMMGPRNLRVQWNNGFVLVRWIRQKVNFACIESESVVTSYPSDECLRKVRKIIRSLSANRIANAYRRLWSVSMSQSDEHMGMECQMQQKINASHAWIMHFQDYWRVCHANHIIFFSFFFLLSQQHFCVCFACVRSSCGRFTHAANVKEKKKHKYSLATAN